jgi:hypothetical protein
MERMNKMILFGTFEASTGLRDGGRPNLYLFSISKNLCATHTHACHLINESKGWEAAKRVADVLGRVRVEPSRRDWALRWWKIAGVSPLQTRTKWTTKKRADTKVGFQNGRTQLWSVGGFGASGGRDGTWQMQNGASGPKERVEESMGVSMVSRMVCHLVICWQELKVPSCPRRCPTSIRYGLHETGRGVRYVGTRWHIDAEEIRPLGARGGVILLTPWNTLNSWHGVAGRWSLGFWTLGRLDLHCIEVQGLSIQRTQFASWGFQISSWTTTVEALDSCDELDLLGLTDKYWGKTVHQWCWCCCCAVLEAIQYHLRALRSEHCSYGWKCPLHDSYKVTGWIGL